jgi:hypothetical protein
VVTQPLKGFKSEGGVGLMKGLGRGVAGILAKVSLLPRASGSARSIPPHSL